MDLKDKLLDYAKTKYIVAMIIVFLMGIAINQISTRMAEGSWDNAINEIKDKDLAKIVDQYHSARENVVWWSISSEFGAFIAASVTAIPGPELKMKKKYLPTRWWRVLKHSQH